jgi:hypothetical protein
MGVLRNAYISTSHSYISYKIVLVASFPILFLTHNSIPYSTACTLGNILYVYYNMSYVVPKI